jgi:uncharacterized protein (DUF2147 family)
MFARRPSPRRLLCTGLLACLLALAHPAARAANVPPVVGDWLTEGGDGVIQIAPCAQGLCGRIVGITRAPGEPMPVDFQGKSQCGLLILTADETPIDGAWRGHITDPRNGTAYQARLRVDAQQRLLMRGFVAVPLLGETQTWPRFIGRIGPECRFVMGNGPSGPNPAPDKAR